MRGAPGTMLGRHEQRLRAVHAETYADLLRFVRRRLPDDDAEDVVSSVFLTAWRRVEEIPHDARPWLYGIAYKVMANHRRGIVRRRALEVRVAPTGREAGDDAADAIVGRVHLVRAWRSLSPRDREALALVAFDGLTGEQAADVLGCRRTAFAMRLNRARTRLRAALDAEGQPARPDHLVLLKETS